MTPDLLQIVLIVGVALRLTRLVVDDTIGFPLRVVEYHIANGVARGLAVFISGMREPAKAGAYGEELVSCPHCTGFWMSLVSVGLYAAFGDTDAWLFGAGVATVAYAVGHISARLD